MFLSVIAQKIVVAILLIIALLSVKKNCRPYFAFSFMAAYIFARIFNFLPLYLDFNLGLVHNWLSYILWIAWVFIFLLISPLKARDIGLTLKQRSGTVMPAVILTVCIIAFKGVLTVLLKAYPANFGIETLLFQITMPALAQEILYSGLLLSLLIVALGGRQTDQDFDWNRVTLLAVFITAFSHGICFGLGYNDGLHFSLLAFIGPFLGKLIYAYMRLFTGSLLFPVLAFSASNFVVWLLSLLLN